MAIRLLTDEDITLFDGCGAHGTLAELFVLFLQDALDLSAAVQTDTSGFHPGMKESLTLITARACPNVTCQSLTHVTAEVEVLQEEGVWLSKTVTVAYIDRFCLLSYDYFKVHDLACFSLLHLNSPGSWSHMLSYLFKSLWFTHLKLEWFPEKIEQSRAPTSTLASFQLLTWLCPLLLNRMHIFCLSSLYKLLKVLRWMWIGRLRFKEVAPKTWSALLLLSNGRLSYTIRHLYRVNRTVFRA